MQPIIMSVIAAPEEGTRAVLVVGDNLDGPILRSDADFSYFCGKCGAVLMENMKRGQVRDIVIKCRCGAYNEALDY